MDVRDYFVVDTILCFWKFDDDFRFQLTREEYHEILMSKKLTSKLNVNDSLSNNNETNSILRSRNLTLELRQGKYSKYLPYVIHRTRNLYAYDCPQR